MRTLYTFMDLEREVETLLAEITKIKGRIVEQRESAPLVADMPVSWALTPIEDILRKQLAEARQEWDNAKKETHVEMGKVIHQSVELTNIKAELAAANEDAERLAARMEFQRAWLTWCPDDDNALAAHAARVGGEG